MCTQAIHISMKSFKDSKARLGIWTRECSVTSVLSDFFATLWTVAHQDPLSMGILQPRILEWVAISSSRGSSQSRDQTQIFLQPRILEWVAISSSRGSSQSRDQTQIFRIADGFFTFSTAREAPRNNSSVIKS